MCLQRSPLTNVNPHSLQLPISPVSVQIIGTRGLVVWLPICDNCTDPQNRFIRTTLSARISCSLPSCYTPPRCHLQPLPCGGPDTIRVAFNLGPILFHVLFSTHSNNSPRARILDYWNNWTRSLMSRRRSHQPLIKLGSRCGLGACRCICRQT